MHVQPHDGPRGGLPEKSTFPAATARMFVVACGLAAATAALLVARSVTLLSPLMAGDAYAYFAHSRMAGRLAELYAADPSIQPLNNPFFFTVGRLACRMAGGDGTLLLRGLNVGLFIAGCGTCVALVRGLAEPRDRLGLLLVLLAMPLSSYCQMFMPEMLYFFGVAMLTAVVATAGPPLRGASALAAGAVLGLLFATKPHAVAVAAAIAAFVVIEHWRAAGARAMPDAARGLASVAVGACLAYAAANAGFHGGRFPADSTLIGGVYAPFVTDGLSGRFDVALLLAVLIKHLAVDLAIVGVPLIVCGRFVFDEARRSTTRLAGEHRSAPGFRLVVWSLLVFAAALLMTVAFTAIAANASAGEAMRLHGRYYSFSLPLLLAGWVGAFPTIRERPWFPRWSAASALVAAAAAVGCAAVGQHWFILYPWDYPEATGMSRWPGFGLHVSAVPWLLAAATMVCAAVVGLRPRWTAWATGTMATLFFVAAQSNVWCWQGDNSRHEGCITREARAIASLLPDELRDRGLVVGEHRYGRTAFALYGLMGNSRVLIRPSLSVLTRDDIPADAEWILTADPIAVDVPCGSVIPAAETTFYRLLHAGDATASGPLVVDPASPADPTIFVGFNAREAWGRWSSVPVSRMHLPRPVVGSVVVRLRGWVIHPNPRQLVVELGEGSATTTLEATSTERTFEIDAGRGGSVVTLRGVDPVRPNPWDRPLAVALQRLEIAAAAAAERGEDGVPSGESPRSQ